MNLRQKQSLFAILVSYLIHQIDDMGYEMTFGETWRSPQEAARLVKLGQGIKNSLHTQRLAIDINLFKNGKYLTSTESYRFLGEWWQTLHPLCRWGGDFGDGNHFSLEHEGRK